MQDSPSPRVKDTYTGYSIGCAVVWAVILAVAATLAAGFYPAWRIGRLSPAVYLKSQ